MLKLVLQIAGMLLALSCKASSQIAVDKRCYLDGGGSAVNFFANEDIAVGATVGSLRVLGDPNKDITLSLREIDSPVFIAPGTKQLVVAKPLDKEGLVGPSAVFVNVICERKFSDDPGIIIPVNVRVTDINDNAPIWLGAPYKLNLSEVTIIGTRILQGIRASDLDQPGPYSTVEYQTLPGPHSDYVAFVTPFEGTLVLKKQLDFEVLRNFTVKLRAQDQGKPPKYADTFVAIQVLDSDDQNPKFLRDVYYGELPPLGMAGEIHISPESIRAEDQDAGLRAGIQYSIVSSNGSSSFEINPVTGAMRAVRPLPSEYVHSRTIVVKATQVDNPDRYALATVIVSRSVGIDNEEILRSSTITSSATATTDGSVNFARNTFYARIREDAKPGTKLMRLSTNGPSRNLQYSIVEAPAKDLFTVGQDGEIVLQRALSFRKQSKYSFSVNASDGAGSGSEAKIIIDVLQANLWEPRFKKPFYSFTIDRQIRDNLPLLIGQIEAADGDRNDRLSVVLKGSYTNLFKLDSHGNLWLLPSNRTILPPVASLLATAIDSGSPPKSTSVPVVVKFTEERATGVFGSNSTLVLEIVAAVVGVAVLLLLGLTLTLRWRCKRKRSNQVQTYERDRSEDGNIRTRDMSTHQQHHHHHRLFMDGGTAATTIARNRGKYNRDSQDYIATGVSNLESSDFASNANWSDAGTRKGTGNSMTTTTTEYHPQLLQRESLNHSLLHYPEEYDEKTSYSDDTTAEDRLTVYF